MGVDYEKIQTLIKFIAKSGVSEIDLETEDFKINVKNGGERIVEKIVEKQALTAAPIQITTPIEAAPIVQAAPAQVTVPQAIQAESAEQKTSANASEEHLVTVKSPMIGTFYRSPSPDKPPFVGVGDTIEKGKVLCIIEAMKLFNEIESEVSGKIIKVLIDDTQPVEYDQPLFLVEPN